ncbi:methanol/ethanol family PQQ-dependent dehydrogenase [Mesorhizobium ciceri]|uniref:PQQ-dependent dehydrogenase, methanol/ethanol family n=1 Tax=Mesorhizobium ciceri biovar biserrulae (strain HAMBI 2942 / LMG 23838 / WSM1271) TaxID=765698 RepID=E8TPG3_MESCW|nr:methanol/ethanol family PQQ-dependent dehydrogenase [Mesorhizobium ciceri]ADV15198.1 PQQ-dependent dehydrogenase, methanol/ethanol family [Mesorhizobium ciceri biovar biserrulae WSM1271]
MKGMLHPAPARVDAGHGARALATENSFRTGILSVMLLACGLFLSGASEPASAAAIAPPAAAAPPDDGQWTMPAKNYASTRFSELSEINEGNVKNLQVAFTFSTGVNKGQEAAPLVVGNNMYIVTPFPNIVYALDLSRPGAPMKWKYEPNPEPAAQGVACCDVVNRGAAFANGRIFFNTLDGHTIALDANTGKPIWNTHIGNINIGETITMAPLVVKGKVLVGNSGGEMGVRGWVKALDAGDGHVVWTAYGTGPDKDVLIGPDFKPHYDMDRGTDLGVTTWPPEAWKIGGGNMWGWISYDPELNLIFHGTGNPGPWNPDLRPGDNKWTSGIFARDADTGAAKWFYQWSPHDLHDYDGINEQILLDMTWQGKPRRVLVRPERNGYLYILDRTTGEVLSATAYGPVNSSKGVDLKTGRLIANPDKRTGTGKVVRDICPTASGLKDWQPSAFSPRTGLLYIPHNNLCMDEEGVEVNYIAGTPYVGMNVRMIPGPGGNRGAFTAWDVSAAKPAWVLKENFPVWSGTVVTAGDVVFYGTMEGWFKAVSARTGDLLWQFKTSSGIIGQPITYRGPDGHQYVAILSGVGGWAGAIVSGDLDPRDATAALGFVNAMKDLKNATTAGGTLYVFRLP